MPLTFAPSDSGILPDRMIAELAADGGIRAHYPFAPGQIQPASLDLRLGSVAYRVRASFLPGPGITVAQRINELKLHEFALSSGAVLETGCVYIVPLIERLGLPADIAGSTNPKSSTGRLDVFTRVIADETRGFDRVQAGYSGPLYAEISPKTFPVLVREGTRLSQLRLRRGEAALSAEALRALHASERLVDRTEAVMGDGIAVSIDLSGSGRNGNGVGIVGYRAKRHTAVVEVDQRDAYEVADFWEPIAARADKSSDPRSRRVLHPCFERGGTSAARLCGGDGAVRSAGRRIPCALCRLLRSGLRLCGVRGNRIARGA